MTECIQSPNASDLVLVVRGARQHNLKNVDVAIPKNRLVVFTGVSGSGKSSLAFDTIFAEGQRRYVESLSAYARQFLGQMDKPDVDSIDGLTPAIAIDQKSTSNNPRSTVGTVTEIYDYLRVLYARVGRPHCPTCHRPIEQFTVQEIVDRLLSLPVSTRLAVLAPQFLATGDDPRRHIDVARKAGYVRLRVGGEMVGIDDADPLVLDREPTIEIVVDRLVVRSGEEAGEQRSRIADSVEQALKLGLGTVRVAVNGAADLVFTENFACPEHGAIRLTMEPRGFSFNNPEGACPECDGLGAHRKFDPDLVLPRFDRSIVAGAVAPWRHLGFRDSYYGSLLLSAAHMLGIDPNQPLSETSEEQRAWLLWGRHRERVPVRLRDRDVHVPWDGVIATLDRFYKERANETARAGLDAYMSSETCPVCHGARLRPEVLAVTIAGANIADVTGMTVSDARRWFRDLVGRVYPVDPMTEREQVIAGRPLDEVVSRLDFMDAVGLHYLTLERSAGTLSGGESQRIRLATQIGSSLSGVLYILDEPSVGLHPRDTDRLIGTLHRLRDLGNSVLVVEHDETMVRAGDYLIDLGPGAGIEGGRLIAAGPVTVIASCPASATGRYLSGRSRIPVPKTRRPFGPDFLLLTGAREHNLKNLTVEVPLGCLIAVVGVSGSGKSTLVEEILFPALARRLNHSLAREGNYGDIHGVDKLAGVVDVNQTPLGRSPRSNPATYVGAFGPIRDLFASTPEARIRGYRPGRFSFNVKGGRCEACEGDGVVRIEMQLLPDVFVPCSICKGRRYNREALEIHYKGKNIADILDMTIQDALDFFSAVPALHQRLGALDVIGLGYMRLGQAATTLSGGEAQRVKLAAELARRARGKTLYLLDEPTTGLHPADVSRLLLVLGRLVDAGHTVLVIEHNVDVIKCADWIIELGPGGGVEGGELVAVGTPEQVAANPTSVIAPFIRRVLELPAP